MEYKPYYFEKNIQREAYLKEQESILNDDQISVLIDRGFCTAPASTKYHGAYAGGLFDHSVNVAETLAQLTEQNDLKWERPTSPLIVGLLHDLCKIDQYRWNEGTQMYEYRTDILVKGHGVKSVIYCCDLLDLKLTEEEEACILYHMGAFTDKDEWRDYTSAVNKYPNVLWTHTADMIASHVMGV